jgi:hypothetical protein
VAANDRSKPQAKTVSPKAEPVLITLHEAVPARSVRALAMKAIKAAETLSTKVEPEGKTAEPEPVAAVSAETAGK